MIEAVKEVQALATPCTDSKAIAQVGTISANSTIPLALSLLRPWRSDEKAIITVEEGTSLENELEVVEGMQFDRGYLSPYFINNQDNMSG